MIPIQLTENHFISPEAIAHVWCNPKTAARDAFLATFGPMYYRIAIQGSKEPKACVETVDSATGHRSKVCE